MNYFKPLLLSSALLLSACTTTISNVASDGTTDHPVFPDAHEVNFNKVQGTFPTADELAQVKAGMTKDQFYQLLGRPHFDEGLWGVREWDYVFHFHTPGKGTNNVSTCQFKILYDKDKYARSFFWKAVDPVDGVCPPLYQDKPGIQRYTLNMDALFKFDKSGLGDIQNEGQAELQRFAQKILSFDDLKALHIMGHTDEFGTNEYNQALSNARAETVRRYLVSLGVPAGIMSTQGFGETMPVVSCKEANRDAQIRCLQPNRRVEIAVDGSGILK